MRDVTYSQSTETELVAQAQAQTALLTEIKQHTAVLYWLGIISLALMGIGALAYLANAVHG